MLYFSQIGFLVKLFRATGIVNAKWKNLMGAN